MTIMGFINHLLPLQALRTSLPNGPSFFFFVILSWQATSRLSRKEGEVSFSLEKCRQMGYTCGETGEILDASELRRASRVFVGPEPFTRFECQN
jgi:hypothetical protein